MLIRSAFQNEAIGATPQIAGDAIEVIRSGCVGKVPHAESV
jgi:hypothetical protein